MTLKSIYETDKKNLKQEHFSFWLDVSQTIKEEKDSRALDKVAEKMTIEILQNTFESELYVIQKTHELEFNELNHQRNQLENKLYHEKTESRRIIKSLEEKVSAKESVIMESNVSYCEMANANHGLMIEITVRSQREYQLQSYLYDVQSRLQDMQTKFQDRAHELRSEKAKLKDEVKYLASNLKNMEILYENELRIKNDFTIQLENLKQQHQKDMESKQDEYSRLIKKLEELESSATKNMQELSKVQQQKSNMDLYLNEIVKETDFKATQLFEALNQTQSNVSILKERLESSEAHIQLLENSRKILQLQVHDKSSVIQETLKRIHEEKNSANLLIPSRIFTI